MISAQWAMGDLTPLPCDPVASNEISWRHCICHYFPWCNRYCPALSIEHLAESSYCLLLPQGSILDYLMGQLKHPRAPPPSVYPTDLPVQMAQRAGYLGRFGPRRGRFAAHRASTSSISAILSGA